MADSSSRSRILTKALRVRRTEPFEESLGRVVRDAGGDFGQYLGIISDVRDYARLHSLDLRTAAKALARQA